MFREARRVQRLEERRQKVLEKEIAAFDSDARPSQNPMAAPFLPGFGAGTQPAPHLATPT